MLDAVRHAADGGLGEALRDHLAPEARAGWPRAGDLPRELAHEVGACRSEDHRHHEGARPFRIVDRDAMNLGHRLREEGARLEESGGLDPRERERDADADAGDDGACAHRRAAAGDRDEIAALENLDDLRRGCVGVVLADAPHMGEDEGALNREQALDSLLDLRRRHFPAGDLGHGLTPYSWLYRSRTSSIGASSTRAPLSR